LVDATGWQRIVLFLLITGSTRWTRDETRLAIAQQGIASALPAGTPTSVSGSRIFSMVMANAVLRRFWTVQEAHCGAGHAHLLCSDSGAVPGTPLLRYRCTQITQESIMFEAAEVGHKLSKGEYKRIEPALRADLLEVQYEAFDRAGMRIRRCAKRASMWRKASVGWWISIWRSSSTGSTTIY
jgi:hypothetical protein